MSQESPSDQEKILLFDRVESSINHAQVFWTHIQSQSDATLVLKDGTFGDLGADQEVKADVMMGKEMTRQASGLIDVSEVITEEGTYGEAKEAKYTVFIDPLDSSANAVRTLQRKKQGLPTNQNDLPFGTVVSFAENKGETVNDVVAAGFVRLDTGFSYVAVKNGGFFIISPDGRKTKVELSKIDLQPRTISDLLKNGWTFWTENYYPQTRTVVNDKLLGPNEKGYIRSQGCGANEQVTVAAGEAAAFFCTTAKYHEPAASILMVKEAGGVAVNPFTMEDLGSLPLRESFRTQKFPLLLAMNKDLAEDFNRRLQK